MSQSEVERFAKDLKVNPALLKDVGQGAKLGLAEAVKVGGQHGYRFSLEEAKAFVQGRAQAAGRELDDRQLDKVAGGTGRSGDACTMCNPG